MKNSLFYPLMLAVAIVATVHTFLVPTHAAYIPQQPNSGEVFAFAGPACPTGSIAAQGQTVTTASYPTLFAAIGYTWGGSGSTFQLPDARGYFLRGLDSGAGRDPGRVVATSQADAIKSHNLDSQAFNLLATGSTPISGGPSPFYSAVNPSSLTYTGATETRPKNIAILYCIIQ